MTAMTLHTMTATVRALETKVALHLSKAFNLDLSATTRRKYEKPIAKMQRELLEARKTREDFIDKQRVARGLKPRPVTNVIHARRH